ncbi:hypothetical protein GXM_02627 [Nostoc sphaeroides CCNUC1]|uniref:Uncharacterized protein n=1 Tax=Nostoc sphaeroides CCNUC1 TaxID=2653204 RepID=A0A5P8VXN8_9NOSO|nr:hypothetical protein GXM_02627 [Nostoc sphaeroides CCNUC1]
MVLNPVSEAEVLDKLLFYCQGKLKIQASLNKLSHQAGEHLDF